MPTPDPLIAVLREWLAKADNDLTTAAHTLTLDGAGPTDTAAITSPPLPHAGAVRAAAGVASPPRADASRR